MGDPNMLDWRLYLLISSPALLAIVWAVIRRRK